MASLKLVLFVGNDLSPSQPQRMPAFPSVQVTLIRSEANHTSLIREGLSVTTCSSAVVVPSGTSGNPLHPPKPVHATLLQGNMVALAATYLFNWFKYF